MALLDSDDLKLLTESVDRFVQDSLDNVRPDDVQTWKDVAALGWIGIDIDPDHGGMGGGASAVAAVMRGIGRGLLRLPYVSTSVMGAGLIERAGSSAHKTDLLAQLINGDLIIPLADRESGCGYQRQWVHTSATQASDGYRLKGHKQFVLDAPLADYLLVTARLEKPSEELGLFLLDPVSTGVETTTYRSIDGRLVADIDINNVWVASDARLPGDAAPAIVAVYELATLAVCAEACGIASALNELTLDYLKTRRQFGATLGSFQVLQHRMVDMSIDEQQMSAISKRATELFDSNAPGADRWISAAKAVVSKAGRRIAEESIQLHGGMGLSEELIVGRYLKRMLAIATLFGDENWHLDQIDSNAWNEIGSELRWPQNSPHQLINSAINTDGIATHG